MKISIITACRNAAGTIRTALESVRRQQLDGFELEHIVIDGASTDGTADLVRAFAEKASGDYGFRWHSEKDDGLYDAINKGIRMATGDVIGILNADDAFDGDSVLSKIAAGFVGPGTDAVYADIRFVRSKTEDLDELRAGQTVRYCTGRYFRNWMFRFATFPAHPSTFVRKACFEKCGLYSLDYWICADFEMMLRLFYRNGIRTRYLPVCTTVMRLGGLSTGGFRTTVQINREDLRALRANGVWSCLPMVYLRYFAKIWGFVLGRRLI